MHSNILGVHSLYHQFIYLPYNEEREDDLGQVKQLVLDEADCQTVAFQVIHEEVD